MYQNEYNKQRYKLYLPAIYKLVTFEYEIYLKPSDCGRNISYKCVGIKPTKIKIEKKQKFKTLSVLKVNINLSFLFYFNCTQCRNLKNNKKYICLFKKSRICFWQTILFRKSFYQIELFAKDRSLIF